MPDLNQIRPLTGRRRSLQRLALRLLPLMGWRVEGQLPEQAKFILIVYPHTSNWDVPVGFVCGHALGLLAGWPYGFMAKDSATRWPVVGRLLLRLGALAIDRSQNNSVVDQMAQAFARHERLMLAITPEGTRGRTGYWKSGFYHIALKAGVPVVPAYLDYRRRAAGLGPAVFLSGEVEADLNHFRAFYSDKFGLHPEQAGEIRFKSQA